MESKCRELEGGSFVNAIVEFVFPLSLRPQEVCYKEHDIVKAKLLGIIEHPEIFPSSSTVRSFQVTYIVPQFEYADFDYNET